MYRPRPLEELALHSRGDKIGGQNLMKELSAKRRLAGDGDKCRFCIIR